MQCTYINDIAEKKEICTILIKLICYKYNVILEKYFFFLILDPYHNIEFYLNILVLFHNLKKYYPRTFQKTLNNFHLKLNSN